MKQEQNQIVDPAESCISKKGQHKPQTKTRPPTGQYTQHGGWEREEEGGKGMEGRLALRGLKDGGGKGHERQPGTEAEGQTWKHRKEQRTCLITEI